jgi:hypothetical protein
MERDHHEVESHTSTVVQTRRMNPPITHIELKGNDTSTLTDAFSDDAVTMKAANVRRVTVRLHVPLSPLSTLMARQS